MHITFSSLMLRMSQFNPPLASLYGVATLLPTSRYHDLSSPLTALYIYLVRAILGTISLYRPCTVKDCAFTPLSTAQRASATTTAESKGAVHPPTHTTRTHTHKYNGWPQRPPPPRPQPPHSIETYCSAHCAAHGGAPPTAASRTPDSPLICTVLHHQNGTGACC